jgi:hypothetical protein
MLINTNYCYLPELFLSFPHHSEQVTKFHLIFNFPFLSSFPTCLLIILTVLKQNRHELNDTAVCVAVYSQWWVRVRFYFKLQEIPSKLLSQRNFLFYKMLLRQGTGLQIHVIEANVAVLWGELSAVC